MRAPLLLLSLLLSAPALAQTEELPPRVSNLTGTRAMAMGDAFRSVGTANETIYLNPAGLHASSRYQVDLTGNYDFGYPQSGFGASIADSSEGFLAGGLAANRFYSGPPGARSIVNVFHLALAIPLGPNLALGASGKWLHVSDLLKHNVVTPDVGLLLRFGLVNAALVAYNLIDVRSLQAPRQFAAAVSVGSEQSWKVALDAVGDATTHDSFSFSFHAGGEYLVLPFLSLRAGYIEDRIRATRSLSGGIGLFFPPGVGVDLAYRHQLGGDDPARMVAVTFKFQPFSPEVSNPLD